MVASELVHSCCRLSWVLGLIEIVQENSIRSVSKYLQHAYWVPSTLSPRDYVMRLSLGPSGFPIGRGHVADLQRILWGRWRDTKARLFLFIFGFVFKFSHIKLTCLPPLPLPPPPPPTSKEDFVGMFLLLIFSVGSVVFINPTHCISKFPTKLTQDGCFIKLNSSHIP